LVFSDIYMAMQRAPHLVIDGYNVIHAWPELYKEFRRGSNVVCQLLVDAVGVLYDQKDQRLTVVFDGKGDTLTIDYPSKVETFSVIYSPSGVSADAIIERLAARSDAPADMTVASRDNMVCESVSSYGVFTITPDQLKEEVDRCQKQQTIHLLKKKKEEKPFGRGFFDML
jgi:uncharacterized protein